MVSALTGHSQPSKSPQEAPLPLSIGSSWDLLPPNLAEEVEKLIITIPLGEGAQWSRGDPGRAQAEPPSDRLYQVGVTPSRT